MACLTLTLCSILVPAPVPQGDLPWPKRYAQLDEPLPPNAVRLLVVPFEDVPALVSKAAAAAADVAAVLPSSTKVGLWGGGGCSCPWQGAERGSADASLGFQRAYAALRIHGLLRFIY